MTFDPDARMWRSSPAGVMLDEVVKGFVLDSVHMGMPCYVTKSTTDSHKVCNVLESGLSTCLYRHVADAQASPPAHCKAVRTSTVVNATPPVFHFFCTICDSSQSPT